MSSLKSSSSATSMSSRHTASSSHTVKQSPVNNGFTKGGDLTLRSLDGVEFRVHSVLLSVASPVFADMFAVGTKQGVVTLAETSDTLSLMLQFIYPKPIPAIPSFETWTQAMHVANKYQLEGMKSYLRGLLSQETSPVSVYYDPLRGLEAASSHGFKSEAKIALNSASYYYDFKTVESLVALAQTIPTITPWVKLIGTPAAKSKIITEVLFNFHQAPMRLSTSQCAKYLCRVCKPTYSQGSHHSPPEWQARWAHYVFQEIQTRPTTEWPEMFKLPFFYTALYKGGELPMRTTGGACTCPESFTRDRTGFLQWTNDVFEVLKTRLACIGQLEMLN